MRAKAQWTVASAACAGMLLVATIAYRGVGVPMANAEEAKNRASALPPDAIRAEEAYKKALLASLDDPQIDAEQRYQVLARLARLDYVPAYEQVAALERENLTDTWLRTSAVSWDVPRSLMANESPQVRVMGVWLATIGTQGQAIRDAFGHEKDPVVRGQLLIAFAHTRDMEMLAQVAKVAGDAKAPDAERNLAQNALASFLGVPGKLTPGQFKEEAVKLANMVARAGESATEGPETKPAKP